MKFKIEEFKKIIMASTFPAAIANEPPPLDGSSEDEDSEEFRSHGLKLDVPSGEPTPVSTPFKRPLNKSPDKVKTVESGRSTEDFILSASREESQSSPEEVYLDCNDHEGRIAHTDKVEETVNGVEDDSDSEKLEAKEELKCYTPSQEDHIQEYDDVATETNYCDSSTKINYTNSNIPHFLPCEDSGSLAEQTQIVTVKATCDDDEEYTNRATDDHEDKPADHESSKENSEEFETQNSSPTPPEPAKSEEFLDFQACETEISNKNDDPGEDDSFVESNLTTTATDLNQDEDFDDDDDDFGAFQSIPHPPQQQETPLVDNPEDDDDDDFGDFAHNSVQAPPSKNIPPPTSQPMAQTSQESMEDFADFQDCSVPSCDGPNFVEPPTVAPDITLITSKIDTVIKSLFVIESNLAEGELDKPNSIDSEISISGDSTWAQVQDFEGSHGLMFKWLRSLTGKRLLRSLNINTSNIVYHEKWGTIEVPKFAASLVQSPLQPQSCNQLDAKAKSTEHPAIVNNNTIISNDHDKPPSISPEAQEILRQLPDLSYMRANTLVFPQSSPSGL